MSISTEARPARRRAAAWPIVAGLLVLAAAPGCRQDMHDQPSYSPLEASTFFADGTSAREPVPGTVARGRLFDDTHLYTGLRPGETGAAAYHSTFPFAIEAADLDRGHDLFNAFCSMCHDRLGSGNGMVVQRGFRRPTSLHDKRLRDAPAGYIFDVITNGYGMMPDYKSQIPAEDRWRIIAHVRALQLSQNATIADVPAQDRARLREAR